MAKMIPYFALGMVGLALCILAAKFLFEVPIRGSICPRTCSTMFTVSLSSLTSNW